ncbi:DUF1439 domain-containing protein [Roseateles cellulosilyticus]|uniref:DUF1439 domain-containing protein n=1 Tax=Pelomonas cellulosilytica TaxID=2906762 RepID=A0ABS8XV86_9BURK|nr:DUF1439 domain-containing protein [Pelomonas sp. P8]MCE4554731.1 DUF1439 domain-containing protein [Pelomonas sp. P8]
MVLRLRTRLPVLVATVLAAAGLSYCSYATLVAHGHLDITQAELQSRIAPRFPVHHCKLVIACLDLANPLVVLTDGDDRIGFTADVSVTLGSQQRTGHLGLAGRPRYAPDAGQLFIDELEITTLSLPGFPAELAELVKARGVAAAREALQSRPVYTLDTTTAKGALAKQTVRDVKVVGGRLRVSFVGASG